MWKKLNNPKGAWQPPTIGEPVLQETTLDEKAYPGLGIGIRSPTERDQPPPRPTRDNMEPKGLPRFPL